MPDESMVQISVAESASTAVALRELADALSMSIDGLVGASSRFRDGAEAIMEAARVIESSGGFISENGAVSGASHALVVGSDADPITVGISDDIESVRESVAGLADDVTSAGDAIGDIVDAASSVSESADAVAIAGASAADSISEVGDALSGTEGSRENLKQSVDDTSDAVADMGGASAKAADSLSDAAKAAQGAAQELSSIDGSDVGDTVESAIEGLTGAGESATTLADRISGVKGFKNPVTKAIESVSGLFGDLGLEIGGADGVGGIIGKLTKFGGAIGIAVTAALAIPGLIKEGIDIYQTARDLSIDQTGNDRDLLLGAREFAQVQFASYTSGLSEDEAKSIQEGLISARLPFDSTGAGGSYEEGFAFSQNARLNYGLDANQAVKLYVDQIKNGNKSVEEVNAHLEHLAEISEKTGITLSELHEDFRTTSQMFEKKFGDSGAEMATQLDMMFGSDEELQSRIDSGDDSAQLILDQKRSLASMFNNLGGIGPGTYVNDVLIPEMRKKHPNASEDQLLFMAGMRSFLDTSNQGKAAILLNAEIIRGGKTLREYIDSEDWDGLLQALTILKENPGSVDGSWQTYRAFQQDFLSQFGQVTGSDDPRKIVEFLSGQAFAVSDENIENVNREFKRDVEAVSVSSATESASQQGDYYSSQTPEELSMNQDPYLGGYASGMQVSETERQRNALVAGYMSEGYSEQESIDRMRASRSLSERPILGALVSPLSQSLTVGGSKSFRDYFQEGDFDGLENALTFAREKRPGFWEHITSALRSTGIREEIYSDIDTLIEYLKELKNVNVGNAGTALASSASSSSGVTDDRLHENKVDSRAESSASATTKTGLPSVESITSEPESSASATTKTELPSGGGTSVEELIDSENYGKLGEYVINVESMSQDAFEVAKDKLAEYYPKIASMDTASQISNYLTSGAAERDKEEEKKEIDVNIELSIEGDLGEVLHRKMVQYEWRNSLDDNEGV